MIGLAPFVFAGEPTGSSQNRDKREDSPADPTEAPNIDVRLAEAKLKLAEADLRSATEWNRRLRGTIPKSTVEWLQQNVKLAKEQVDIARQGKQPWHALHVRQMEATLRTAQSRLERAEAMNRAAPSSASNLDLERFRLKVEVARLNLTKAQDPANIKSPEAHLQLQVDQLRDEVDRLKDQVERLSITSQGRF
jgi:multidrug resistance efflux pump